MIQSATRFGLDVFTVFASFWFAAPASAQLMSTCAENSPERQGEIGCTIIATKTLPDGLKAPVFWHIDRFQSLARARESEGAASVAFEAGGTAWLMTIESQTADHHGGRHEVQVGPLQLPQAAKYAMQVQTSAFMPGMYSLAHHHSGVEAVYVLEGQACFETPTRAATLRKGESLALPTGTLMRATVTGPQLRRLLAIIVHDAAQPATMRMDEAAPVKLVECK